MIVVALFFAAFVLALTVFGLLFIVSGVNDLLLGDITGIVPVLFGLVLVLNAASLAVIFFVPA